MLFNVHWEIIDLWFPAGILPFPIHAQVAMHHLYYTKAEIEIVFVTVWGMTVPTETSFTILTILQWFSTTLTVQRSTYLIATT